MLRRRLIAFLSMLVVVLGVHSIARAQTTGQWALTGAMVTARRHATATQLPDGRVLLVGGVATSGTDFSNNGPSGVFFASAELYDPWTGTFSSTGGLTTGARGSVSLNQPCKKRTCSSSKP